MYRRGGVYVVIGGAGGIGTAWSEYMIRTYGAHIIWIGRRQMDAAIEAKIDSLSRLGPAPRYLSADARDTEALRRAYNAIKQQHDGIHRVVHSVIDLRDQRLANMDEAGFRAAFSAKVDVSAAMAHVFRQEPLDFVLFLSALTGFFKPEGQSNYAAGCTFQDAFAHWLTRESTDTDGRPAIKIMNWGYWGQRPGLWPRGLIAIAPSVQASALSNHQRPWTLETLLAAPIHQIALWKTIRAAGEPGCMCYHLPCNAAVFGRDVATACLRRWEKAYPSPFLSSQELDSRKHMHEATRPPAPSPTARAGFGHEISRPTNLLATYDRWLEESLATLVRQGPPTLLCATAPPTFPCPMPLARVRMS